MILAGACLSPISVMVLKLVADYLDDRVRGCIKMGTSAALRGRSVKQAIKNHCVVCS